MSEAYATGGHTRIVERWMAADCERTPTVGMTGWGRSIPRTLHDAARAAGGGVVAVGGEDPATRACNLLALARQHDLIVLHTHEFDVVPALAFSDPSLRPPVALLNHAAHSFWLGLGVADTVINLHAGDVLNTVERRGCQPERALLMPMPIAARTLPNRAQARTRLGIDPNAQVILVVGASYKFARAVEPNFTSIVRRVLSVSPNAQMIVVGPAATGEWAELQAEYHGRVRPLGVQASPILDLLMPAANLLLDSWPFSGWTTMLDAAYSGLPVVSIVATDPDLAPIRPSSNALGGTLVGVCDADRVADAVASLLRDRASADELGARAHAYVVARHVAGWQAHLEDAVQCTLGKAGAARVPCPDPPGRTSDWEAILHLIRESGAQAIEPGRLYLSHAAAMAPDERPLGTAAAASRARDIVERWGNNSRRLVVAPCQPDRERIRRLLDAVWRLVSADVVDACRLTVDPVHMDAAVRLLRDEMTRAPDLDIELVASAEPERVAPPRGVRLDASYDPVPV